MPCRATRPRHVDDASLCTRQVEESAASIRSCVAEAAAASAAIVEASARAASLAAQLQGVIGEVKRETESRRETLLKRHAELTGQLGALRRVADEEGGSLWGGLHSLHSELVSELPGLLRSLEECASQLHGSVSASDLSAELGRQQADQLLRAHVELVQFRASALELMVLRGGQTEAWHAHPSRGSVSSGVVSSGDGDGARAAAGNTGAHSDGLAALASRWLQGLSSYGASAGTGAPPPPKAKVKILSRRLSQAWTQELQAAQEPGQPGQPGSPSPTPSFSGLHGAAFIAHDYTQRKRPTAETFPWWDARDEEGSGGGDSAPGSVVEKVSEMVGGFRSSAYSRLD
mmetsp:Transcript_5861/g.18850  ORF Transcript_5861/g.18850 Transcript_5861/m.18850 type:complete len:345 (-) Transcript_5861:62-1096(-)